MYVQLMKGFGLDTRFAHGKKSVYFGHDSDDEAWNAADDDLFCVFLVVR